MDVKEAANMLRKKPLLGHETPHSHRYVVLSEDEYRLVLDALEGQSRSVPKRAVRNG